MKRLHALWHLPFVVRRGEGSTSLFLVLGFLLLTAVGTAALLAFAGANTQYVFAPFGVACAMLICYWWAMYLISTADLCSLSALELTPRLRQSILYATSSMWLGLSLLILSFFMQAVIFCALVLALALSIVLPMPRANQTLAWLTLAWVVYSTLSIVLVSGSTTGSFSMWQLDSAMLVWALAASILGCIGISLVFPFANAILIVVVSAAIFFYPGILPSLSTPFRVGDLAVWMPQLIIFAVCAIALTLFGLAGFRRERLATLHRHRSEIRALHIGMFDPTARARQSAGSGGTPRYFRFLERKFKKNTVGPPSMAFALGPGFNWSYSIVFMLCVLAIIVLSRIFMDISSSLAFATSLVSVALPAFLVPAWIMVPERIFRTRREQCQLSLSPKWPRGRKLNTWLGRFIMRHFLLEWLTFVSVLAIFALAYETQLKMIIGSAIGSTLCAMIACGYALMNYARAASPSRLESTIFFCAIIVAFLSTMIVATIEGPIFIVALPFAAMSLGFIGWRWRRLVDGPAALPAIRVAR